MVAGGGGNLLTTLLEGLYRTSTARAPRAPAPQDGAAGGGSARSALRCPSAEPLPRPRSPGQLSGSCSGIFLLTA